jgi:predicted porin
LESALNINYGTNPNGRLNDSLAGTSSGAAAAGPANASVFSNGEGSVQGQMFDREASLGLSGSWGTLKGGRMTTVMADTIGAYDPLRVGYAVSPLGFNGGYSGAGYTGESRWDNSLKYIYNAGPMTAALGYKTAGTTNGISQGSGLGATFEYAPSNWGVKLGYEQNNDAFLATNGVLGAAGVNTATKTYNPSVGLGVPALTLTFADTNALTLVGKYITGPLTFKGGYERITTAAPNHAAYDTATNFPTVNGLPVSTVSVFSGASSRVQTMTFGGVNYQLNERVELSAAYYRLNTNAYGANGSFVGGNDSSSRANYIGFEGTYALSKRTRVYATAATNSLSGPVWTAGATQAFPAVTTYTTGVVHSF